MADMNRTTKGALLGAGVGLLTGNGVNGVLKGAAVGAGVGAVTEKGRDGKMRVKVQSGCRRWCCHWRSDRQWPRRGD